MIAPRRQLLTGLVLAVLVLLYVWVALDQGREGRAEGDVEQLFRAQRSEVMVEFSGEVSRILADDLEGSRHQRFIVRLESGHTVLVSHNIDLAPRVESIAQGDVVTIRGQYEWNERGGVVHWTHHDPDGRRQGGWIRRGSDTYR
jgi:translation initiation factor IF-1